MRMWLAALTGVFLVLANASAQEFHPSPWVSGAHCSTQDAIAADRDLDNLADWQAVHRTFKLYAQCDDGGVAEGYSDSIVELLTKQWPTVVALAKLVQSDPMFGQFVLRHVDSLMSPEQGKAIVDNAKRRCPSGIRKFCRRLEERARNPL